MRPLRSSVVLHFVAFLITLTTSLASAQTPQDIIRHYIDTVSSHGHRKFTDIKTLYAETTGYFSSSVFTVGAQGDFESDKISYGKLYRSWPYDQLDQLYYDSLYKDVPGRFYFSKSKTVILLANMPPMSRPTNYEHLFEFPSVRVERYMKESKIMQRDGLVTMPENKHEYLGVTIMTNDDVVKLYFDRDSYLLKALCTSKSEGCTVYSDYQLIDGYLVPTMESYMKNGLTYSWKRYVKMVFNEKIEKKVFEVPK